MVLSDQIERAHHRILEKDKPKCGDIKTRVRGNLTAVIWKDKRAIKMLTNMHHPPTKGTFYDEHRNSLKPATVHMGYGGRSDHITNIIPLAHGPGNRLMNSFSSPGPDDTE
jgi:hypothetical protein